MLDKVISKPAVPETSIREKEKIKHYSESKLYRENLIIQFTDFKTGTAFHQPTDKEKGQLDKQIGILKNNAFLSRVFNEPVEMAKMQDLINAMDMLQSIAKPNLLQYAGVGDTASEKN